MPNASAKAEKVNSNIRLFRKIPALRFRAAVLAAIRRQFDSRGFVEVETPVAISAPAAEEYIEAPRAGSLFLRTSPELEMKRLLCAGMDRIYQIGPCFRQNENGRFHRSEFDMLEFYLANADYLQLLDELRSILIDAAKEVNGEPTTLFRGSKIDFSAEWEIISVRDAFRRFAGESADKAAETEALFEQILTEQVEPALPKDRPCVLIDYPIRFGAFARAKATDPTLVERWELYVGGVELANTYGELTDPVVQRQRFELFRKKRASLGMAEYPQPEAFLSALDCGMPPSAGSALGFDRLVMLLAGKERISDVAFPLDAVEEE